ncbi:MAG: VCBS repeat-containing protein, partial [Cyanobacteria bacterium J06649_11]
MRIFISILLFIFANISNAQIFTQLPRGTFTEVARGSISFSDIDNDGDQDVFLTGSANSGGFRADLYENDGNGNYSLKAGSQIFGASSSASAFGDIDNDGDDDLIVAGVTGFSATTKLYKNNGLGDFFEVSGTPFIGVSSGAVAFSDIDNDQDLDLLITGSKGIASDVTKLYLNDSLGNFTEVPNIPFDSVSFSSIAFADIDGDNDEDVFISGASGFSPGIAKLYKNDGTGSFTEVIGTPFTGVFDGGAAFSDVDNDNDLDLFITGNGGAQGKISILYSNDGSGTFLPLASSPFDPVSSSAVAFSDVDLDGDNDLLFSGVNLSNFLVTKLYLNDGSANFTEDFNTSFLGVENGAMAFADIDGDNDEDVLISGLGGFFEETYLYINNTATASSLFVKNRVNLRLYPNPADSELFI